MQRKEGHRQSNAFSEQDRRRRSSARRDSHRNSPPPSQSGCASQRWKCLLAAALFFVVAAGAGCGLGFLVYPSIFQQQSSGEAEKDIEVQVQSDAGSDTIIIENEEEEVTVASITSKQATIDSEDCGLLSEGTQNLLRSKRQATNEWAQHGNIRTKRIVGGGETTLLNFPWQVSLWTGNQHSCGGSLVSTIWIVTAAHCTDPYPHPQNWTIFAGATSINEMELLVNSTQRFRPTHVITHPDFDQITYDNDVALMRLDDHVVLDDVVSTICLPDPEEIVAAETECLISGWGALSEGGDLPEMLQQATVKIISRSVCNAHDWLMGMVSSVMICAGEEDGSLDACQGDSGGPLTCLRRNGSQKYFLHGLVSWGIGCGVPQMPGVYTDVRKYRSWIIEVTTRIDETA